VAYGLGTLAVMGRFILHRAGLWRGWMTQRA